MDSSNILNKKICLSKSQFNKNIRSELNNLDNLRKNNISHNSLPIHCTSENNKIKCNYDLLPNQSILSENIVTCDTPSISPKYFIKNNSFTSPMLSPSYPINCNLSENLLNKEKVAEIPNLSIPEQLKEWAVKNKITHVALGELLSIYRQIPEYKDMSKEPR